MLQASYQKTVHGPDWGLCGCMFVFCIDNMGARKHRKRTSEVKTQSYVKVPRFLEAPLFKRWFEKEARNKIKKQLSTQLFEPFCHCCKDIGAARK